MRIEDIAFRLRSRVPYEAVDLGYAMTRSWVYQIYPVWFGVYAVTALMVSVLCMAFPLLAWIVMWWLKPALDRVILHVLAGAAFGAAPTWRDTLRAIPALMKAPGLMASLTWRRFSRSFLMPVEVLEGQRGKGASQRRAVLAREGGGAALWLTVIAFHFEGVLIFGTYIFAELLLPGDAGVINPLRWMTEPPPEWMQYVWNLMGFCIVMLLEPFYVAAGFALYLNARTILEGWDIELAFKRMSARLAEDAARGARAVQWRSTDVGKSVAAVLFAIALLGVSFAPGPSWAQSCPINADGQSDSPDDDVVSNLRTPALATTETRITPATGAVDAVTAALTDPVFGETRTTWRIKYIGPGSEEKKAEKPPTYEWLEKFGEWLAVALRALAWGLGAAGVVAILYVLAKRLDLRSRRSNKLPDTLFGFDIRPESLPDDIPGAARAMLRRGDTRAALSLLYRGALVSLLTEGRFEISRGDTEGQCVQQVVRHYGGMRAPKPMVFAQMVTLWQRVAYAHQRLDPSEVEGLITAWATHFVRPVHAGSPFQPGPVGAAT